MTQRGRGRGDGEEPTAPGVERTDPNEVTPASSQTLHLGDSTTFGLDWVRSAHQIGHVVLHVVRAGWETGETGVLGLARPGVAPDERVFVFQGYPPPAVQTHRALAPVVLVGDMDGRLVYAERVPMGALLEEVDLPNDLLPLVVRDVLDALEVLRQGSTEGRSLVHGAVMPDRVWLGVDGEVVLFGRGRRGGLPRLDIADALGLQPEARALAAATAGAAARLIGDEVLPDDRSRLADAVRDAVGSTHEVSSHPWVITLRGDVDEVVPDLGDDPGGEGLFDGASTGPVERTATRTEGNADRSASLWGRLAAPPRHLPPHGRFAPVQGIPSRAVLTLVAEAAPDPLPGLASLDRRFGVLLEEARLERSTIQTTSTREGDTEFTGRPILLHPDPPPVWRSPRAAATVALLLSIAALVAMVTSFLGRL